MTNKISYAHICQSHSSRPKNEVIKISEGEYKVKLTAAPIDGKANGMLIDILAEYFGIAKAGLA